MKFPNYRGKSQELSVRIAKSRLDAIERMELKENRASLIGNVHFMDQQTSFVAAKTWIRYTKAPTGTTSTVAEDSNANLKVYLTIEDPFGDGTPIASPYNASDHVSLPIGSEWQGKTGYYHGYYQPGNNYRRNLSWDLWSPTSIAHTTLPSTYRSMECNIPGNSSFDRKAYIYFVNHSDFNLVNNQSHSIWFYPTSIASAVEAYTYLQYHWQNATNWYAVLYETASPNHIIVYVVEGGTTVKREVNLTVPFNTWNLVVWKYDATANTLTIRHNNVADSITPADTVTAPFTTDSNLFLGGVPLQEDKRIEGYLGPYFMWWQLLTTTEMGNLWTHGTTA